ncbi:MAG: hypothetical protein HOP14_11825 [Acidobacteria bacterium]|nr:hypothetical protein [Acidobacteriota bacterium]
MRRLALFLCLWAALGCTDGPTGPTIPLAREFSLAPGETASIEGTNLSVRFRGVRNDSRCPADAVCIQGGDALVLVTVMGDGASRDYDLHAAALEPVRHGAFEVALLDLQPYPLSSRPIAGSDYRAFLRVTRW